MVVIGCFFMFSLLGACHTKKNIVKSESTQATSKTHTAKADTSRTIIKTQANLDETVSIHETTDRETIHLDSIGRVRTIVRESISKETGQRRTDRGQGSVVSMTGRSESDSASVIFQEDLQEKIRQDVDSRLIQGTEWMWVILSGVLVLAVLLYISYNKYSK